ncbi:MAG: hypothetical protein WCQ44_08825, partial [Opitutaceae bacterium]
PPYENTRRLTTHFDVKGDAKRAHSSVTPGSAAGKNTSGQFIHEDVWRYLFTHPIESVGPDGPTNPDCGRDLPKPTPSSK